MIVVTVFLLIINQTELGLVHNQAFGVHMAVNVLTEQNSVWFISKFLNLKENDRREMNVSFFLSFPLAYEPNGIPFG